MKHLFWRYAGGVYPLKNWSWIRVEGTDAFRFLQGQVTNDLKVLDDQGGMLCSLINRLGRVQYYFYVMKSADHYFLFCPQNFSEGIIKHLDQYLIMDDVSFKYKENVFFYSFWGGSEINQEDIESFSEKNSYTFIFNGEEIQLYVSDREYDFSRSALKQLQQDEVEFLQFFSGGPSWEKNSEENKLINESILAELSLSLSKGCFLGQEVVAKVDKNKSYKYSPVLFKINENSQKNLKEHAQLVGHKIQINNKDIGIINSQFLYEKNLYLNMNLHRRYRVNGSITELTIDDKKISGEIIYFPFFKDQTKKEKAKACFLEGSQLFTEDKEELAIQHLKWAIQLDKSFPDAYEALGVIYGRHEKYHEAIRLMHKLLEVEPKSVMAHTNLSLYHMKLGNIEEAEKEKSLATLNSFEFFGDETKKKEEEEEREKRKFEEMDQRKKMFEEVLTIDSQDTMAHMGLGEIYFEHKNYNKSMYHSEKVLSLDENYIRAYLVKGKCHLEQGQNLMASDIFKKGIEMATQKGELKTANEMQELLNHLQLSK